MKRKKVIVIIGVLLSLLVVTFNQSFGKAEVIEAIKLTESTPIERTAVERKSTAISLEELSIGDYLESYEVKSFDYTGKGFDLILNGYYILEGSIKLDDKNEEIFLLEVKDSLSKSPVHSELTFGEQAIQLDGAVRIINNYKIEEVLGEGILNYLKTNKLESLPVVALFKDYRVSQKGDFRKTEGALQDIISIDEEGTSNIPKKIVQAELRKILRNNKIEIEAVILEDLNNDGVLDYVALGANNNHKIYYLTYRKNQFKLESELDGEWGYWIESMKFAKIEKDDTNYLYLTTTNDLRMRGFSLIKIEGTTLKNVVQMSNPTGYGETGFYDENQDGLLDGVYVYENDYTTTDLDLRKYYDFVEGQLTLKKAELKSVITPSQDAKELIYDYLRLKRIEDQGYDNVKVLLKSFEGKEGVTIEEGVNFRVNYDALTKELSVEPIKEKSESLETSYLVSLGDSSYNNEQETKLVFTLVKEDKSLKVRKVAKKQ